MLSSLSFLAKLTAALSLFLGIGYFGYSLGSSKVSLAWERDKVAMHEANLALQEKFRKEEEAYRDENARIRSELAFAKEDYDRSMASLSASWSEQLRQSNSRADNYRRQAEGGAAGCARLAAHAGELDRALAEGRQLVRALRDTLEFRESQLGGAVGRIQSENSLNRRQ